MKTLKDLDPMLTFIGFIAMAIVFLYSNFATNKYVEKVEAKLDDHLRESKAHLQVLQELEWKTKNGTLVIERDSRRPARTN